MIQSWDGVRPIVYANPYLANLGEFGLQSELYDEAVKKNYLVKNP